jgi:hypothetical protein
LFHGAMLAEPVAENSENAVIDWLQGPANPSVFYG